MLSLAFSENQLEQQSGYLYRFALVRLRDDDLAREAVQETFLAALENGASFAGKSSLKTWLTAILKFKIVDLIRRQAKEPLLDDTLQTRGDADERHDEAEPSSAWGDSASAWATPEEAFEQKRFWEVFGAGLAMLPAKTREVFTMRDVFGHSTEEICKKLKISETNCWVILHRARMAMRNHLSTQWFTDERVLDDIVQASSAAAVGTLRPAIEHRGTSRPRAASNRL